MNLFFLVEGRNTEPMVYPKWLEQLCPKLSRKDFPEDVVADDYCLQSGLGYPSMLFSYLPVTVELLNNLGVFDFLVLCLDSDGKPQAEVVAEIEGFIKMNNLKPRGYEIKIVIQNVAIETWFLGNQKVFQRNPESVEFREFIQHYDVSIGDPEKMPAMDTYSNLSEFHHDYLRLFLAERNMRYTKNHPGAVTDPDYLSQLILRTTETTHLQSLRNFLEFCDKVNS